MVRFFHLPRNFAEFCYRLIRGSLYAFTFILCILGLSLITFSFWYIYEGKNYHLDTSIKFCIFSIAFAIGFVLLALSCCGLTSVLKEKLNLAKLYLIGMMFLIVCELICVLLIYIYKVKILSHAGVLFQNLITHYTEDDDIRVLVDKIQSELKCCGISSPDDWELNPYYKCSSISTFACSVPKSCCYNYNLYGPKMNMLCGVGIRQEETTNKLYQMIHLTGCKYAIYSFLDYKHKLTATILIGFLIPQLIGVMLIIGFILVLHHLISKGSSLEFKNTVAHDLLERNQIRSNFLRLHDVVNVSNLSKKHEVTSSKQLLTEPSAPPVEPPTKPDV